MRKIINFAHATLDDIYYFEDLNGAIHGLPQRPEESLVPGDRHKPAAGYRRVRTPCQLPPALAHMREDQRLRDDPNFMKHPFA
jgi:hypothetical protein